MTTTTTSQTHAPTLSELVGQDEGAFDRYLKGKGAFLEKLDTDADARVARHMLAKLEQQMAWVA